MAYIEVTHEVVIGTVDTGAGDMPLLEALFLCIGRNGKNGTYRFPGPDEGMTTVVTVEGIETEYKPDDVAAEYSYSSHKPRRKA